MGETAGENPPPLLAVAPGYLATPDGKDPPLQRAPAASEVSLSSPASTSSIPFPGSGWRSKLSGAPWHGGGGVPPSELWTQSGCRMSLGPPAYKKLRRDFCSRIQSMDVSTTRVLPSSLVFRVRYFPTNRAGASNPGDGSGRDGAHTGHPPVRSTAAVLKGSAVNTQSPAASSRPRHRGLLRAGQHASLLLA